MEKRIEELAKIIEQDNEKNFLTNFERMRIVNEYCKLVEEKGK
jgi:hypothetical protein